MKQRRLSCLFSNFLLDLLTAEDYIHVYRNVIVHCTVKTADLKKNKKNTDQESACTVATVAF